jgi:ABC-type nitrate/sulfonate/bicarbonate transport system substrate-binding protein
MPTIAAMKKLHLLRVPILLIAITFIFVGCNRSTPENKSSAPVSPKTSAPETIRLAYAPVVLNIPVFLGQSSGVFKTNNITIDAKLFTSANEMINAIVADQVDAVTGVSLVPILNLEAQDSGRVRVILHSRMTDEQPYDGLVVKTTSTIRTLSDLKGHKIGLYPGTTAINLLKAFLKKKGVAPDDVEFVPLPPASHVSAIQSGAVDVLFAYDPTLTTLLQLPGFRRLHGSVFVAMLSPSPISSSIISRKFEREHPEAARRFIQALDQSVTLARQHPVEARLSLTNYTKLPIEVIPHVSLVADTLSTETSESSLQQFIDLMVEIGELPKKIAAKDLLSQTK